MSIAWTTIFIIALLLPGVFAFVGYSANERVTREILKTSAIGEVGLAIVIAIVIHLALWFVLWLLGFDLAAYIRPLANFDKIPHWIVVNLIVSRIAPVAIYIVASAFAGYLIGWLVTWLVGMGYLPGLGKHKWIYSVQKATEQRLVTAYVMTTTVENDRALMYKGLLAEFYLTMDGNLTYVVLKDCSRYFMGFSDDAPNMSKQLPLFGASQENRNAQFWDFLFIDGENIANILFDQSPPIEKTKQGTDKLDEALAKLESALNAVKKS